VEVCERCDSKGVGSELRCGDGKGTERIYTGFAESTETRSRELGMVSGTALRGQGRSSYMRGPPAQYDFIIANWYSLSRVTYNYFILLGMRGANSNWHLENSEEKPDLLDDGQLAVVIR